MEAAVSVKEVMNPRMRFAVGLSVETRAAPTITAKPIIRQFSGLVNRRSPVIFPMVFISAFSKLGINECCFVESSYNSEAFRFCL